MQVDVAFVPALLSAPERRVALVVDVLRASSTLVTMFARGLAEVVVAGSLDEARTEAARRPGWLLCGEELSLPPEGFDHGNSPAEYEGLDLSGRRAVFATTNGTRALGRARGCRAALVAAVVNLSAAARAAVDEARRHGCDITVVCSGREYGGRVSLEDVFCAGGLVLEMARATGGEIEPAAAARAAQRVWQSFDGEARAAFEAAQHGRGLVEAGLGGDLDLCARRDRYGVVPRLDAGRPGELRVVPTP
jgi:2-phosphosulfolactate phosphatase